MKKRKGMTLIEVIISIAIYGVMALLVAEIMTLVNATMRATKQLNDRLSYEAKYADNLQTVDDHGNALTANIVSFQIRYDNSTKLVGGATGGTREALEYTASYDNSHVVGTKYSEDVNYRFMTFDRVASNRSEYPGPVFTVYIRPVPYFAEDGLSMTDTEKHNLYVQATNVLSKISSLTVKSTSATSPIDGGIDELVFTYDHGDFVLGSDQIAIPVENHTDALPDGTQNVEGTLTFTTMKDYFDDGVARTWNEADGKFYLYVKVGASDENATFYNRCLFEWNVLTGEFNVSKSFTMDDTFPATPVYP